MLLPPSNDMFRGWFGLHKGFSRMKCLKDQPPQTIESPFPIYAIEGLLLIIIILASWKRPVKKNTTWWYEQQNFHFSIIKGKKKKHPQVAPQCSFSSMSDCLEVPISCSVPVPLPNGIASEQGSNLRLLFPHHVQKGPATPNISLKKTRLELKTPTYFK